MTVGQSGIPDARQLWMKLQTKGLGTRVAAVTNEIRPLDGSRVNGGGKPLEWIAPSSWHVGCMLMIAWVHQTIHRKPVESLDPLYETFFGMRAVFRGQTRPWCIKPKRWRSTGEDDSFNDVRLQALKEFLTSQMDESDALELKILGRIENQSDADAIAQHYGFPTNLVDFTWDPLTALYFACGEGKSPYHRHGLPPETASYAAVFSMSLLKLMHAGRINVRFPPIQLERLYRQRGMFVDFGNRPSTFEMEPRECGFSEPWMWVEQNALMVLFPNDEHASEMRSLLDQPTVLPEDGYLKDVVDQMSKIPVAPESECPLGVQLGLRVTSRPPWRIREMDPLAFIYTDEEFHAIGSVLSDYIQFCSMVLVNGGTMLDPLIVGKMTDWDRRLLTAILEFAGLPFAPEHIVSCKQMIHFALGEHLHWKNHLQEQGRL